MSILRAALVWVAFSSPWHNNLSKAGLGFGSWTQRIESPRTGMSWHKIEYIYGGSIWRRWFLPSWWIRKESAGLEAEARTSIKDLPMSHLPKQWQQLGIKCLNQEPLGIFQIKTIATFMCPSWFFKAEKQNKTNKNHLRLRALAFLLVTENVFSLEYHFV